VRNELTRDRRPDWARRWVVIRFGGSTPLEITDALQCSRYDSWGSWLTAPNGPSSQSVIARSSDGETSRRKRDACASDKVGPSFTSQNVLGGRRVRRFENASKHTYALASGIENGN
jgi:hypothetical protein